MARYFFHLRDGADRLLDPEGRSIENEAEIPVLVRDEVRALIAQEALGGRINLKQRLEVEDEKGAVVHELQFRDAVDVII